MWHYKGVIETNVLVYSTLFPQLTTDLQSDKQAQPSKLEINQHYYHALHALYHGNHSIVNIST